MDTASQIKKSLISRIENSSDLEFLKALQTLIETSEMGNFPLTIEQENSIKIGREEIKNGNSIENGQLMSEVKEWLSEK